MNSIWIASMILQWLAIVVLSILVLSLVRQLGEMSLRLNAVQEKEDGLKPYSEIPSHEVTLLNGEKYQFGGLQQERPALVLFFSSTCGACEALPEAVLHFLKSHSSQIDLLVVLSIDDREAARKFIAEKNISSARVALQQDFPEHFVPRHGVPFAFSIAISGLIAARGRPKEYSHLFEMAEAAIHMADMTPDHSRRKHDWGESAVYWQTAGQKNSVRETAPTPLPR